MHYVHCPLTHFHHCSQGRVVTPRQGPAHTCHLRKYCIHTANLQAAAVGEQRPTSPNQDTAPGSGSGSGSETSGEVVVHRHEMSAPDGSQNISTTALTQPHTPCPSPSAGLLHISCHEWVRDGSRCCDNHICATATHTDARCKVPGNQERREGPAVTREESVKTCKQNSKRERASSASPKKLNCFNRTLKVKCNSTSEFNVPKSEAGVPPVAISTNNQSSESLC